MSQRGPIRQPVDDREHRADDTLRICPAHGLVPVGHRCAWTPSDRLSSLTEETRR